MVLFKLTFTPERRAKASQALWIASSFCVFASVLTLTLGLYLKCELSRRNEVMDNSDIHLVPNALILLGLLGFLLNLSSLQLCGDVQGSGAFARWKPYLLPYWAAGSLLCLLMLFAGAISLAMGGTLEGSLRNGLKNGVRFYKDTDTPGRCYRKRTIDLIQMEFGCCGNNDHRDWFDVQWVSNRYLDFNSKEVKQRIKDNVDGRYLIDGVPFSCCNPSNPRPCIQSQVTNNSAHYNYDYQTEQLNIWRLGCREALLSYFTGMMSGFGSWVLLFLVSQVGVLVGIRYVITASEAALAQNDSECETEGFLLENGPKETLLGLLESVKKACNLNQVETAATAQATEPAK